MEYGSDARQVMDRLISPSGKSTETGLCTPQKQTAKFAKTPENSAKKKKLSRLSFIFLNTLFLAFLFLKTP